MIQEHVFLLRRYYELNHYIKLLREEFEREYANQGFPICHTVYNMNRKFKHIGSDGDALHSGRLRDARTEENVYAVAQAVVEEPTWSTRNGALKLGLLRLYTIKISLCKKVAPSFPSANLDSDFYTTPYFDVF